MTTDTAVRVTRMVVQDKSNLFSPIVPSPFPPASVDGTAHTLAVPLDKIPYDDFPELKFNSNESTEMPFRYVKNRDGKPIMPEVRLKKRLTTTSNVPPSISVHV